jgi:hypothetical protein
MFFLISSAVAGNCRDGTLIMPVALPSKSFSVHHSSVLPFDPYNLTTGSAIKKPPQNKISCQCLDTASVV